jgi:hypothetical protein
MRRHPLDPLSLLAGLGCIALAVAALAGELEVRDLDRGLLVPTVLIVVAVLLVAGLRRASTDRDVALDTGENLRHRAPDPSYPPDDGPAPDHGLGA